MQVMGLPFGFYRTPWLHSADYFSDRTYDIFFYSSKYTESGIRETLSIFFIIFYFFFLSLVLF